MTATAVRTTTDQPSVTAELRARLESEQRAVTAEIEALDAFVDRIEGVPVRTQAPVGRIRGPDHGGGRPGLEQVREAYEETVMSVPHYDTDYGDTYRESVVAEFGPEVGTALTDGPGFQAHLKRATIGKARSCRADREQFLEVLAIESESIAAVGDELRGIRAELQEFDSGSASTRGYGALEAEWRRLDVLGGTVDRVATTRQQSIIRQRREFTIPSSAPDVPTYLYHEFDDAYPLLSACVTAQTRIERYKSERERGLAGQ